MDEFIKLLGKDCELVQYQMKDKAIAFHIKSSRKELACPFCGSKSMHTHSVYERKIQVLPLQEKRVTLLSNYMEDVL
ncbi:MAG: transposase family protein [Lachnospiraceae bacterium]|nr:transposase family protein [Lachnospiraceae bacterium]